MKKSTKNKLLCIFANLFAIITNVCGISLLGILKNYQGIPNVVQFICVYFFCFNIYFVAMLTREALTYDNGN